MAGRANTFRPLKAYGCGGLSAMIFIPASTQHCAASIQAMRGFGIYDINYPKIYLYAPQKVYDNIVAETKNIDNWAKVLNEEVETRTIILKNSEIFPIYNVSHDRPVVDDTKTIGIDLNKKDYSTWEEAFEELNQRFPNQFSNHKQLAVRRICTTKIDSMEYGNFKTKKQNAIREKINAALNLSNKRNQIAWTDKRYNDLINIEQHYKENSNFKSDYSTGDGKTLVNIPYIVWDNTFDNLDAFNENTMYWIQTMKNTIRIYIKITNNIVSILTHSK